MKKLFLLAGAGLVLALGTPAAADSKPGKGKADAAKVHRTAKGHIDMNRNGVADWREQRLIDANGNGILDWRERRRIDINGNGVPDWREARIDRDRDGIDDRQEIMAHRWGGADCPPGLAKPKARRILHTSGSGRPQLHPRPTGADRLGLASVQPNPGRRSPTLQTG